MNSTQMIDNQRLVPATLVWTSRIVWSALLAGQIVAAIVFDLLLHPRVTQSLPMPIMLTVDASLLVAGVAASAIFSQRLRRATADSDLRARYT